MPQQLPYSSWCYVCGKDNPKGLRVKFNWDGERVWASFCPEESFQGYIGVTHGGVLSTLLDECMGWAPILETKRMCKTAELRLRFHNTVAPGQTVIVSGWITRISKRLYETQGEVRDENDILYVSAMGKYVPMTEKETQQVDSFLIYDKDTIRVFE